MPFYKIFVSVLAILIGGACAKKSDPAPVVVANPVAAGFSSVNSTINGLDAIMPDNSTSFTMQTGVHSPNNIWDGMDGRSALQRWCG